MAIRSMRLTKLNNDGTPIGEPVEVPCRIDDWSIDLGDNGERMVMSPIRFGVYHEVMVNAVVSGPDEATPDTSQPYPLDALIGRIDELTT